MRDEQQMKDLFETLKGVKLEYQAVSDSGTGMRVAEIDLTRAETPFAPFRASRFTVEPYSVTPEDSHEVHEIWMIAEGKGELLYDHQSLRVGPWDVVYFEPPKTHQLKNDGAQAMVVYSIWWRG